MSVHYLFFNTKRGFIEGGSKKCQNIRDDHMIHIGVSSFILSLRRIQVVINSSTYFNMDILV